MVVDGGLVWIARDGMLMFDSVVRFAWVSGFSGYLRIT